MRKLLVALYVSLCGASPALVQAGDLNVGVVISGEIHPGVYGRVEIGNSPPPLLYARPVVILAEPHRHYDPIYLHVPPGHAKHWSRFCGRYDACGRPVYFVKSAEYEPSYRRDYDRDYDRRDDHDEGKGHGKHKDR